jgi:hypothetical protein
VSAQVEIRDGDPYWYLSPDIWVVPGSDPAGPPGVPVAGEPAYVWARIENHGDQDALGVRVDLWWADPTFQVSRTNAHPIGTAFGDALVGGGPQDVLCLVPWLPAVVNGGHECLVAVATYPGDSIPRPLPDVFDPPTYVEVAQKNLTVLSMSGAMVRTLTVAGLPRTDARFVLTVEVGGELDERVLRDLGVRGARPAKEATVRAGLRLRGGCPGPDEDAPGKLRVDVPAARQRAVHLALTGEPPAAGEYQLVRLEQRHDDVDGDTVVGGIAFVVVGTSEKETDR